MNEIESRLAEAMRARADAVEPHDEDAALGAIARRVNARRNRAFVVLGVAAAIAVVVGAVALLRRDDDTSDKVNVTNKPSTTIASPTSSPATSPATTPSTAPTTTTSAASTTTSSVPQDTRLPATYPHIWPFEGTVQYDNPEGAAQSFVAEYLGMVVEREVQVRGDNEGAVVEFFSMPQGGAHMVVDVKHTLQQGWVVTGANADEIVVDDPLPFGGVEHPTMHVSGQSVAFEAQLGLELRPVGSTSPVSTGTAMGGSTEMQPFDTTIATPDGDGPLVLIVFEGDARGEQTYNKATVVLIGVGQQVDASASS